MHMANAISYMRKELEKDAGWFSQPAASFAKKLFWTRAKAGGNPLKNAAKELKFGTQFGATVMGGGLAASPFLTHNEIGR